MGNLAVYNLKRETGTLGVGVHNLKLETCNPKLRIAQLLLIALVAMLFVGADTDARFNKLGHQLMCMCGCNQILLECNHVGCTYSERMRNELTAGIERGDNDSAGAAELRAKVRQHGVGCADDYGLQSGGVDHAIRGLCCRARPGHLVCAPVEVTRRSAAGSVAATRRRRAR